MAFHHNATYMLPSLTFPFHFFYSYECVPLTIFYHLYFRRISYILSMLHQGSVERDQSKECYFKFTHTFLVFFIVFIKKFVFLSFSFLFFLMKYRSSATKYQPIRNRKILSGELYMYKACLWM